MQAEERHGAGGVDGGAGFIPLLLSGEAVAVEDPLQGGFHHPAAGVRNQENLRCASPRRRRCPLMHYSLVLYHFTLVSIVVES